MKKVLAIILMALAVTAVFVSCDDPQHEHSYGTEWKKDATNHWHECSCGEKKDLAAHSFKEVIVDSTCTKEGYKYQVCEVCGYETEKTVIAKKHNLDENLKCKDCGRYVVANITELNKVVTYLEGLEGSESAVASVILMTKGEYEITSPYTIDVDLLTIEGEEGTNIVISKDFKIPEATRTEETAPDGSDLGCPILLSGSYNNVKGITFTNKAELGEGMPILAGTGYGLSIEGNTFTSLSTYRTIGVAVMMTTDTLSETLGEAIAINNNSFSDLEAGVLLYYMVPATKAPSVKDNAFKDDTRDIFIVELLSSMQGKTDKTFFTIENCKKLSKANNSCRVNYCDSYDVIGDEVTYFANSETFESVVSSAESGSTVKLMSNVSLSDDIVIDKDLTIDLNENTLNLQTYSIGLSEDKDITLTIKDGKIGSSGRPAYYGTGFSVKYGNKLTLENVTVSDTNVNQYCMSSYIEVEVDPDATDTSKCPEVIIKGSTITTDGKGIINVEVSDGVAYGNTKNLAKVTISDSELNSSGTKTVTIDSPSTGSIEDSTIKGNGPEVVTLYGGAHTIKNSTIIFNESDRDGGSALKVSETSATVNDSCAATVTLDNVTLTVNNSNTGNNAFEVTGTGVVGVTENDGSTLKPTGKTPTLSGTFSSNVDRYKVAETADVYLTTNDGKTICTSGVENFEKAVSEAVSGQTIKLLADLDLTSYSIYGKHQLLFGENVTVDLNKKTISSNKYGVYWEGDGLTIKNGTVKCINDGSYALRFGYGAPNSEGVLDGDHEDAIKKEWVATVDNVTCEGGINVSSHKVVIKNSTIKGNNYYALFSQNGGLITVESGNFTTNDNSSHGNTVLNTGTSTLGTDGKSYVGGNDGIKGYIVINGGTFGDSINSKVFMAGNLVTVQGGSFTSDPKTYVDENSYTITQDTSASTWTVTPKTK